MKKYYSEIGEGYVLGGVVDFIVKQDKRIRIYDAEYVEKNQNNSGGIVRYRIEPNGKLMESRKIVSRNPPFSSLENDILIWLGKSRR